jgi:hypothetical protein
MIANAGGVKDLVGSLPLQGRSRPVVELVDDREDMLGRVLAEVRLLREVLAEQPVAVLVAATLPRAVGVAVVHGHTGRGCDVGVPGHLDPAVPGQ